MDGHNDSADQQSGQPQEHSEDLADPGEPVDADANDRRHEPRFRVTLDATFRRLGRDDHEADTTTVDVSHGGARIAAPAQVSIGDVIQLVVRMPHGIELTLQGLVVQLSDGEGHHAHVAFDSLSTVAADLLTELINGQAEQQTAAADAARVSRES